MSQGTVYWITGLSGAGKTTVAREFHSFIQLRGHAAVFLDGDHLREVFGNDLGYSSDDRLKSAMRNSRLCKLISDQGIDVICATVSMFENCRKWNREHIRHYKEIYLKVPIEILIARDQKGLYSSTLNGRNHQVMGLDLEFEEPRHSDLVIVNDGSMPPKNIADQIISHFQLHD